jgi:U3 small nucleolar RNA-associated protein 3
VQPEEGQDRPRAVRFEESAMKKSMSKLVKGTEEKSRSKKRKSQSDETDFDRILEGGGDVAVNEDDDEDLLEKFAKKKKQFIADKKAHYTPTPRYGGIEEVVEEGERRPASYEIIKNKGLTPHRAKANRNPRVKKREMFDKKVKARKGQVQDVIKGMAGSYGGESTGIKANLSRSRKIA